jgi:hypothetical protein
MFKKYEIILEKQKFPIFGVKTMTKCVEKNSGHECQQAKDTISHIPKLVYHD